MKSIFLSLCFLILALLANGQSNNELWQSIDEKIIPVKGRREIIPQQFKSFRLDLNELKALLKLAPSEQITSANKSTIYLSLPMPNGSITKFYVVESPVMDAALQKSYPKIKTYSIHGIDDIYANGKIDVTEFGFHGMIRSPQGDVFIDPYCSNNTEDYISYYKSDFNKPEEYKIVESDLKENNFSEKKLSASAPICAGTQLRTYRLAIACTPEYAMAATGLASPTVSDVLAKVVTTVNRVDGVYETEVAVRMVLVSTTTLVLYTSAASSSFTPAENGDSFSLLVKSQIVIDDQIGNLNYDIGHTFSSGSGGLANLGIVCNPTKKAQGVTGSANPVGDPYDIDYVAHEMGHQFGANHTFNSNTGSCAGNRFAATSAEPGSGVTLMGYAGLCGSFNNLENHSIPYFHSMSYDEVMNFITTGDGSLCPVVTSTGNHPPVVVANTNISVALNTPFTLTGTATDSDGDALTYQWEEIDPGHKSGNWNFGEAPFFRSYAPSSSTSRSFPNAAVIASGALQGTKGEYLPTTDEVLHFRFVVRDNKMGGGGVCYGTTQVTIGNPTGLVKYTNANGLNITVGPNPFSDFITVTIKNTKALDQKKLTITIYDVIGNMVKQENNIDTILFSQPYDLSFLSKGSYYIEITNGTEKSVVPVIKL